MKPHIKKVRRKIKRNQTYRTLKVGEIVRKGDEFKISKGSTSWLPVLASIGYKIVIGEPGPFRRPIVKRKPLSKRQVEKNREEAASLAEEKERLLREEDERERAHGEGRFTPRLASDDPTWTKIEFKPDPDLQSQLNEIQADPPALDIQVDTGKPIPEAMLPRDIEWRTGDLIGDRKPLVVAIIVFAVVFNAAFLAGYLTRKRLAQPEIQYRDKIEHKTEYSRPMELNGIPDNPWRKAIPILPEDIKITRGGGQWSAGGPVVVVLDEYTAKNLFLALAQALGAPAEKRSHER